MPEYNYKCGCGNEFSIERKITEYNRQEICPKCKNLADRNMSKNFCNGNYIVNTTGFYGKKSN